MTPIDRYIIRLSAAVTGPRAAKRDLLAEARDHLEDAADAHAVHVIDREVAERQAVAEFGDHTRVAAAFQEELGLTEARRTALLVAVSLLAQPVLWGHASLLLGEVATATDEIPLGYALVSKIIEWLGVTMVLAAVAAWVAAGIGTRWVAVRTRLARATGFVALFAAPTLACLGVALTLLSPDEWALVNAGAFVLLGAFTLAPMAGVAISAKRCLAAAPSSRTDGLLRHGVAGAGPRSPE